MTTTEKARHSTTKEATGDTGRRSSRHNSGWYSLRRDGYQVVGLFGGPIQASIKRRGLRESVALLSAGQALGEGGQRRALTD